MHHVSDCHCLDCFQSLQHECDKAQAMVLRLSDDKDRLITILRRALRRTRQARSSEGRDVTAEASEQKPRKGFARLSPEEHRQIASAGGREAHRVGLAHKWTAETARESGKLGGAKVAQDRAHMAAIGAKGGRARKGRQKSARTDGKAAVRVIERSVPPLD